MRSGLPTPILYPDECLQSNAFVLREKPKLLALAHEAPGPGRAESSLCARAPLGPALRDDWLSQALPTVLTLPSQFSLGSISSPSPPCPQLPRTTPESRIPVLSSPQGSSLNAGLTRVLGDPWLNCVPAPQETC